MLVQSPCAGTPLPGAQAMGRQAAQGCAGVQVLACLCRSMRGGKGHFSCATLGADPYFIHSVLVAEA